MIDKDLMREFQDSMARSMRLADAIARSVADQEREDEEERRRQKLNSEKLRRDHRQALAKKDAWRVELVALEARFGKEFDALSDAAKESTARRVMSDFDFPRWRSAPSDPLYRYLLMLGLLNEDSAESAGIGEQVG